MELVYCVEFQLPSGSAGMAAQMTAGKIKSQLRRLVDEKIIPGYKTKHEKSYKMLVWFPEEKFYSVFALIWQKEYSWLSPKIIQKPVIESPYYDPNV